MPGPALILGFLASFIAGPLLCALLLRLPPALWALLMLAAALGLATLGALRWQGERAALSLGCLWLAWVLAVAMLALALLRRLPDRRRWVTVSALLATTLPWFGLATARLMV